jgi:hypothetical protein
MKKIIFLILICSTTAAFAQKTNFSGTWRLDTTRTTFSTGPHWTIPKSITVDQQSAQLVLTRVNINANMLEQPPVTETLAFVPGGDGRDRRPRGHGHRLSDPARLLCFYRVVCGGREQDEIEKTGSQNCP